ncbi:MAG: VOC family protein [Pseudomonadota bacterium]
MEKALGFGGFFFRAKDREALAAWYRDCLGIPLVPDDYETPCWQQEAGETVFAPFAADTDYFAKDKAFMLNFRVRDLDAMVAQLEAKGVAVRMGPEEPNGRFAWTEDPEGTPIELWEPRGR